MVIHIFNPQNDMALAVGGINYVSPPHAMRLATDLAVLPAYYAMPGSRIITNSDDDARFIEQISRDYNLDVSAISTRELGGVGECCVEPWGWCADMRRRLVKWGIGKQYLPNADVLEHLRGLSHRRVSVLIHKRMTQLLGYQLCPEPVELAWEGDVVDFVRAHDNSYLKTPWSGSGSGIYHVTGNKITPELEQWVRGALKRQGSLLCEVGVERIMDFAVEYRCDDGVATAQGYSIFTTDAHSQFGGCLVAPTHVLREKIMEQYPSLSAVVEALTTALGELVAPHYTDWLGVDMLLFRDNDGNVAINPCVELNLRCTMGVVAGAVAKHLLKGGETATFVIEQRQSPAQPWQHPEARALTPERPDSLYRAVLV